MPPDWNFVVVMPFINEGDTRGTIRNVFHCVDRRAVFDKQSTIKAEYVLPQCFCHEAFNFSLEHSELKYKAVYAPTVFISGFQEFVSSVVNVFKKQLRIIFHNKLTFYPLWAVVNKSHGWLYLPSVELVYLVLIVNFGLFKFNEEWFFRFVVVR